MALSETTTSAAAPARRRARLPRFAWPWLLLMPTFLAIGAVAFWPILEGLRLSLTNTSLITRQSDYVGLENYAGLLSDSNFWNAWGHTVWFTVASTFLETVIGLIMALVLCEHFRFRGLVRAAMLVPWAMPTVVTSKMFGWLFDGQNGVVNWILMNIGLLDDKVNWYGNPDTALTTLIIADVWKTTPFMALLLMTGLQTIPKSLTEAARMDGAGAWMIFWTIRLPLLMPTLLIAGLFRALDAFRVFDLVYVLTGGGPADSTETLSTLAYKSLFSTLEFGYGSTVSTAMFITEAALATILVLWLVHVIRRTT